MLLNCLSEVEPNNAGRHYHWGEVKSLGKSWSIRRRQQQHMAQVVACSEKMLKDFDTVGWTDSWKPGKGAGVQMSPVCHQCLDITQIFAPSSFPSWRTVSEWVMFSDWRELLLLLTFACFFCISAVMQWYVVRNDYTFWKIIAITVLWKKCKAKYWILHHSSGRRPHQFSC